MNYFISDDELKSYLPKFVNIYKKRPIKNNTGGIGFNHSFAIYVILNKLNIKNIYESGVYKGHSTWLIENSLKDFCLLAVDINLNPRIYISKNKNVNYFEGDLEEISFQDIDVENTLIYFDDHTNAIERLKLLYSWGIKYAIFEDNYPAGEGDAYSIRKIINESGQSIQEWLPNYEAPEERFSRSKILNRVYKKFFYNIDYHPFFLENFYYDQKKIRKPNSVDHELFKKIVKNYYEIQPVYRYKTQRWNNNSWEGNYKSLKPVFENLDDCPFASDFKQFENESPNEMFSYTYISLVELNTR